MDWIGYGNLYTEVNLKEGGEEDEDVDAAPRFLSRQIFNFVVALDFKVWAVFLPLRRESVYVVYYTITQNMRNCKK